MFTWGHSYCVSFFIQLAFFNLKITLRPARPCPRLLGFLFDDHLLVLFFQHGVQFVR